MPYTVPYSGGFVSPGVTGAKPVTSGGSGMYTAFKGGGDKTAEQVLLEAEQAKEVGYGEVTPDQILAAVQAMLGSGSMVTQANVLSYIEAAYGVPPEGAYEAVSEAVRQYMEIPKSKSFSAPIETFTEMQNINTLEKEWVARLAINHPEMVQDARVKAYNAGATADNVNYLILKALRDQPGLAEGEKKVDIIVATSLAEWYKNRPEATRTFWEKLPAPQGRPTKEEIPLELLPENISAEGLSYMYMEGDEFVFIYDWRGIPKRTTAPATTTMEQSDVGELIARHDANMDIRTAGIDQAIALVSAPDKKKEEYYGNLRDTMIRELDAAGAQALANGQDTGYVTLSAATIAQFVWQTESWMPTQGTNLRDYGNMLRSMPRDSIEDLALSNTIGAYMLSFSMDVNPALLSTDYTNQGLSIAAKFDEAFLTAATEGGFLKPEFTRGGIAAGMNIPSAPTGQQKTFWQELGLGLDFESTAFRQAADEALRFFLPRILTEPLGGGAMMSRYFPSFPDIGGVAEYTTAELKAKETKKREEPETPWSKRLTGYPPIQYQKPRW